MLSTLYLTLQAAPNGVVSVGCSDPIKQLPLPNGHGREFAFAAVHAMAWDLVAFAAIKGCRVDGAAAPDRINPVLLVGLANALLDPEVLGHVVNGEVRDMARLALGKKPVESYLCPGWRGKPLFDEDTVKEEEPKPFCCGLMLQKVKPAMPTDWSAA